MVVSTILFGAGLLGLVGFWYLRVWEERRGARLMASPRAAWDARFAKAHEAMVRGDFARTARAALLAALHSLSHRALASLVALLRAIERPLARISHRMRVPPPTSPPREPSEFLKTITPDKQNGGPAEPGAV